jgi:hypothetical protein
LASTIALVGPAENPFQAGQTVAQKATGTDFADFGTPSERWGNGS